jgi:hypothetical protein
MPAAANNSRKEKATQRGACSVARPLSSPARRKPDVKRDVILPVDADVDTASVVGSAAALMKF